MSDSMSKEVCRPLTSRISDLQDEVRALEERLRSENLALNKAVASLESRLDAVYQVVGLGLWADDGNTLERRLEALEAARRTGWPLPG